MSDSQIGPMGGAQCHWEVLLEKRIVLLV
jgi:hypothetical protein